MDILCVRPTMELVHQKNSQKNNLKETKKTRFKKKLSGVYPKGVWTEVQLLKITVVLLLTKWQSKALKLYKEWQLQMIWTYRLMHASSTTYYIILWCTVDGVELQKWCQWEAKVVYSTLASPLSRVGNDIGLTSAGRYGCLCWWNCNKLVVMSK